jgi:putative phosphoesterase
MRVAVLADIHGNLPALEAVLRDVHAAGVDAIVLNGDLADGPMPAQTLDRLEELGDRAVWVRGNSDRWLAEAFDGTFQPAAWPRTRPPPTSAGARPGSGKLTGTGSPACR